MFRRLLERPIGVSMLFAALVLVGALSYSRLAVDLLPSITYPRLTVLTTYEDIPAEDLERLVTQRLEEVVTSQAGVRDVVSRTREGVSILTVEFDWGTQMDFATLHLREAVDRVVFRDDFPEDADRPVILRWDPASRPISILVLRGDERLESLTEFGREVIKPILEQVDGISRAEIVGGADREILVEPDAQKMALYGLGMDELRQALVRSNISFPGGKVRRGPLQLSLRIDGEFEHLAEIAATDIRRRGGRSLRIGDVARVLDTVKEPEGATLLGERVVVAMLIYKEPEANTLQASESVDRALEAAGADYADFDYTWVYRDAEHVRASFEGLVQSLLIGGALAIVVLFFFLGDLRSPLVVGLAIPVSIVITFGLLFFGGVKLNLMSLGGLSLAAGMLVDNSIVVLENINRHLRRRAREASTAAGSPEDEPTGAPDVSDASEIRPPAERRLLARAADEATVEVARPVIAATFTTIAVFFPVVYVPGVAGAFFRDQALTVTFSLLVSIGAALLLQPVLSVYLLRAPRVARGGEDDTRQGLFGRIFGAFAGGYHRILVAALDRPKRVLAAVFVGLVAAGFLAFGLDRSFLPERSLGDMRIDLEWPAGTPLEETVAGVAEIARWIEEQPGVAVVFSQVGQTERTLAAVQEATGPHHARMRVILERAKGAAERGRRLEAAIADRLAGREGLALSFREEGVGLGEILGSGGAGLTLGVVASQADEALAAAETLLEEVRRIDGLHDVQMDRVRGVENVVVRLDREEIVRRGLDPDLVARELRAQIAGVEATFFNEVDQRIDIAVRLPLGERRDLERVMSESLNLPGGQSVPLGSLLVREIEQPLRELVRRNQRRMIQITANVEGRSLDSAWAEVESRAEEVLPGSARLVELGERRAMMQSFRDLGFAMLLAMLLVYMILAAQFESFLDPLVIAAVIPIGLAGSAVAVAVGGATINVLSMIGALALLGIVVNDAIVKVDTIRRLRAEGMDGRAAIERAGELRLRPILMTSVTTVLAMVPMAIGLGSGEQLQRPLAITIIGGLSLATALTLIATPVLYQLAHRIRPPEGKPAAESDAP